ncbi:ABC transporter ATP-binding protein [Paenibacillus sp.]|jgi:ABC-type multidrug transport system fused ATPase/permease subunit|uniref:ABC transporter ATP-binding protein n=1 Tax=Paenibacillus sp. TaxID=58172 RepID=UPI00283AB326|nr:ABC transporter ATP-binding protein [Paenibacillus sp.]
MGKRLWIYMTSMISMAVIFVVFLQLMVAYKSKPLFDAAVAGNMPLVKALVLEIGIYILIPCLLCPLLSFVIFYCIQKTMEKIRVELFDHTERLPMSYFDKHHTGEITSSLNNDINALEKIYFWPVFMFVFSIVLGIGSIFMLLSMSKILGFATLLLGVLTSLINVGFARPIRKANDKIQKYLGNMTGRLLEFLNGYSIVKMFRMKDDFSQRFDKENLHQKKSSMHFAKLNACLSGANYFLSFATYLGIIILSSFLIKNGFLKLGTAVACVQLQGGASFMFQQLGSFVSEIQHSLAGAGRVFRILDEPAEGEYLSSSADGASPPSMGGIRMEKVNFEYGDGTNVLQNLTLSVPVGKFAALVGLSGSGKSSLLKLLLGFYSAKSGDIAIEGKKIGQYSLTELRDIIAYVPQDTYLFEGTIADNIRMGKPDASNEEVIAASETANAAAFIQELPMGYETHVGTNGMGLSGGQIQRIGIARALIKDAPILLLDEATSALDVESEELIREAIERLSGVRTLIVVAHRLSIIKHADIIYVMNEGKIEAAGSHEELLEKESLYKEIYNKEYSNTWERGVI